MKTFTIIFLMLFASVSFAQNQPIDFEPGGHGADWTWTVFENEANPPLEIIENPDQSGINTSATVAKFTALEVGNPWAGVESEQGVDLGTFHWDESNRIVKIMVWKPVISDVGIKFATETGWAEEELKVANTVTNEWEELTFDFSNAINPPDGNGTLGQIIIFPDFDEREQDNVIYFDNITFSPSDGEVAPPAPVGFTASDMIGEDPVGPGEVFLACGPNDVGGDIVYRLFYSKTNEAPDDPTTATEYEFGTTGGDGDGVDAFGFVMTGLDDGTSYTFWLYQYNTADELFSPPATDTAVAGGDDNGEADEPETAAPTPPALNPEDVISVFSNAFDDVEGTDFFPDWGQTTQASIVEIEGVQTLKYENFNYQGTQFATPLNVTEMETLHLDMWTADATSVNVFLISTGPEETPFALPITPNEWVSYDIPLTEFSDVVDLGDVIQFKFDGGDGTPTIYLDNLYFFTTPTSAPDISQDEFNVYPNPARQGEVVMLSTQAKQVEVFDMTGKLIQSFANTTSVQTEGMKRGVYFMRIQSEKGHIQTSKLLVK